MTNNGNASFSIFLIDRDDNDGQGTYTDRSFRSVLDINEARKLRSTLKKTMHPSITWYVREVIVTADGWTFGKLF